MKHAVLAAIIVITAAAQTDAAEAGRYTAGTVSPHVAKPFAVHENRVLQMIPKDTSHPVNCRQIHYVRPAGATGPTSPEQSFHPIVCDRG